MQLAKPLIMTALCLSFLSGCGLPTLDKRSESRALTPEASQATPLGRAIAPMRPPIPASPASTRCPTPTMRSPRA